MMQGLPPTTLTYSRAFISNIGQICYDAGQRTGDCARANDRAAELIRALRVAPRDRFTQALEYLTGVSASYDADFAEVHRKHLRGILIPPRPDVQ